MRNLLNNTFIIVGTFAVIWIATIYQWRISARLPGTADVVMFFVVVPTGLLTGAWLLGKIWRQAAGKTEQLTRPTIDSPVVDTEAADSTKTDDHERRLTIAILASAIKSAHGNSAEELINSLKSKKAFLKLDPELADSNGYPILTNRIKDIDQNAQLDAISTWLHTNELPAIEWTSEQLRAIALGSEIVSELAQHVMKHVQIADYLSAPQHMRDKQPLPVVQLIVLLPDRWDEQHCSYTTDWFKHLIQEAGWPVEKIISQSEPKTTLTQAFISIDRLMVNSFRQSQSCVSIVVACESNIGPSTIERWEGMGKLTSNQGYSNLIPGEGAAGLLLADEQQVELLEHENFSRLHRVAQGLRDKSADSKGRISDQLLAELVLDALSASETPADRISSIFSDTDHRGGRITELMGMGAKIFPELDPATQYFKVAGSCGTIGLVSGLIALALGHHDADTHSGTALCLSNIDSHERVVAVVSPRLDLPESGQSTP